MTCDLIKHENTISIVGKYIVNVSCQLCVQHCIVMGGAVAQSGEALRHKTRGSGFDSR